MQNNKNLHKWATTNRTPISTGTKMLFKFKINKLQIVVVKICGQLRQ